jgi:hypothetical chaperone protein
MKVSLRYGLDFGTTNSAVGVYRDGKVELIPVDASDNRALVIPTLLYIDRKGNASLGNEAIERYVKHNVGRMFRKRRVQIAPMIGDPDGPKWAEVDVDTPGRFFQALKAFLPDPYYTGTDVFGQFYTIEALVAIILKEMKARADEVVGEEVTAVTLGRPVYFSMEPEEDKLAEARLRKAAQLAGFQEIDFQFEPFAAALHYAEHITEPQTVLVFDFGGGTLDFSLLTLSRKEAHAHFSREAVLATGGLTIGGNTFNEQIMANRLVKFFGAGVEYEAGPSRAKLGLPAYIIDELRTWYTLPQLNDRQILEFLRNIQQLAKKSNSVDALLALITKNYGWGLFEAIEQTKRELTEKRNATIRFNEDVIFIREPLSRGEFETDIRPYLKAVDAALDQLLAEAKIGPTEIDAIITTGGTSLVPAVRRLLSEKYDTAAIREQEVFTSVVSGLAIAAARTEATAHGSTHGTN